MSIRYPMEHGIVKDWNDMERIWQYIYSKDQLHTFSEEVRHLVLHQTISYIYSKDQLHTFSEEVPYFKDNKFNFAFLTICPKNMAMIFCMYEAC